ncbi:ATP-binding cassette domain-containing protein [Nitrogeniibacter mangrovi]|uniref:ATP-binding cassette domain-containing protein n=1 Tax=Nitrogeniibacter mangrovi TaxID=2016596 RepID=A0A6C1AZX6_9RHOO|nr:ATP-binding cassette domain-containing protein [Nitrogeniibacter mangrovi]QID16289.1 ATP-binding cassette domain-containing protein [Nitrogeniibacter mangrovi]
MSASALTLTNVAAGHDGHVSVSDVTLSVPAGAKVAVIGPNGAGKSTLLKTIAGELPAMTGQLRRCETCARMGYLPQTATVDTRFPISVYEFVAMGEWGRLGLFGRLRPAMRQRIDQALERTGLSAMARRPIGVLSGGQLQRARFARLMLQDAALLLLDEPFAGVDRPTRDALMTLIDAWHDEGRTCLVVLHDVELVRQRFEWCLSVDDGHAQLTPTAELLTLRPTPVGDAPARHAFLRDALHPA